MSKDCQQRKSKIAVTRSKPSQVLNVKFIVASIAHLFNPLALKQLDPRIELRPRHPSAGCAVVKLVRLFVVHLEPTP